MREFKPLPSKPAPKDTVGLIHWIRENFFSSIGNSVATIAILALLVYMVPPILDWLFFSANWSGTTQSDCTKEGACWVFVSAWSKQFFFSSYPDEELWRIFVCLISLIVVIAASYLLPKDARNKLGIPAFLVLPFVWILILDGSWIGLEYVPTDYWGGFSLNVLMAAASIIIAFPLSFLWALGRRSDMPFIKSVCVY
jgi:general L-amino acid transport system permease protein